VTAANLYLFHDLGDVEPKAVDAAIRSLPDFRRDQCLRYHRSTDRAACLVAYLLLRHGLHQRYGIDQTVTFGYDANGKPYLDQFPAIFFNLSHGAGSVACVISEVECGIDIEHLETFDKALANRVCSSNEYATILSSPHPAKAFSRVWTKKESYAKANGTSVADYFGKDLPERFFTHYPSDQYCLSLCHFGRLRDDQIIMHRVSADQLFSTPSSTKTQAAKDK